MDGDDNRQISRDSMFLMADLRVEGHHEDQRVKVRNLSAGGMMAEGRLNVARGNLVAVNIRNIGWVEGTIAWVQDDRYGIAFVDEIDPLLARAPITQVDSSGNDGKKRLV